VVRSIIRPFAEALRSRLIASIALWLAFAASTAASATPPTQPRVSGRVLVLYWYDKDHPINVSIDRGFQSALRARPDVNVEYYAEYLDSNRLPGDREAEALRDYLAMKYSATPIDVVVASGFGAQDFLTKNRRTLFTQAPRVVIGEPDDGGGTGIATYRAYEENLELVMRLHPRTKHVFIVSGTLQHDKRFETRARELLRSDQRGPIVEYLTDLSLDELVARVKTLPAQSVVLYAWQQSQRAGGSVVESTEILSAVLSATRVPVYGMSEAAFGSGIVGGRVFTLEGNGRRAAEMAIRLLEGARSQDLPVEAAPTITLFDWRQLQRWGIGTDRLPPGSVVQFRDLSFWDSYKRYIMAAIVVCGIQAVLIVALLVQRAQRRRAELAAQLRQQELTHMSRVATLGELTGTLAHELQQPLAAILLNAQIAQRQLSMDPPNRAEIRDTLGDIVRADESAAGVIQRVRGALRKKDAQRQPLSVNDVVADTLSLAASELATRRVSVATALSPALPEVFGDRVELQHVMLNLILNACDAESELPPARRVIRIETARGEHEVRVSVTDDGVGIAADYIERIFEPFVTSKQHGLGLGLSICRTIILAHQGRIWAESSPGSGTTVSFCLPMHGTRASAALKSAQSSTPASAIKVAADR
jgi:signal transduction histidine kinase